MNQRGGSVCRLGTHVVETVFVEEAVLAAAAADAQTPPVAEAVEMEAVNLKVALVAAAAVEAVSRPCHQRVHLLDAWRLRRQRQWLAPLPREAVLFTASRRACTSGTLTRRSLTMSC